MARSRPLLDEPLLDDDDEPLLLLLDDDSPHVDRVTVAVPAVPGTNGR